MIDIFIVFGAFMAGLACIVFLSSRIERRVVTVSRVDRVHSDCVPERLRGAGVDELLDSTIDPKRELASIERVLCRHCGCTVGDGSYAADVVQGAVWDGRDWQEVRSIADEVAHWREVDA